MATHGGLVVGQLDPVEGDGGLAVPECSRRGVVMVVVLSVFSQLIVRLRPSSPSTADNPL